MRRRFRPRRQPFERSFSQLLDDGRCLLIVGENDGELVGYLLAFVHETFFANGPVCWIEELMVTDAARRSGVARSLVACAEKWAARQGARLVALATRRADVFWQAVGYEPSATYLRKPLGETT